MIAYISKYYMKVLTMLFEHSLLVFISVGISFLLALILSIIAHKYKTMSGITLTIFIGIYCIPSIALFAFLIPATGLGKQTAIIALVLYNQVLLIRSILEGFNSVPSETTEVAKGLGIGFFKGLSKVEIPLASPAILGGLRVSVISTSGIATIAALINAGGLGMLLFDGMRTNNSVKIWWGVILICSFTLLLNQGLSKLEMYARKNAQGDKS